MLIDIIMNDTLNKDLQNIDAVLESAKTLSVDYLNRLDAVATGVANPLRMLPVLSNEGLGAVQTQALFEKSFLPNIVATSGSRYWGFVTGGTTPAAIAGDWLASVFDQNTQSDKGNGDASGILELHTVKLLLPARRFHGCICKRCYHVKLYGAGGSKAMVGPAKRI
jgi:hypothetical protein